MRELIITTLAIVGLLMAASFAHADSSQLELYYNDYISKKIFNCQRIASVKNHTNPCMVLLMEMRSAQAQFYKEHRVELVREMVTRNVGTEPHKIDHFLITKFKETP